MAARKLPLGTVTFVFTDIEGSTRLLQALGAEAFSAVISQHNTILRQAVGPAEVSTDGDAFFCAFERPADAVQAVVAAQRRLSEHRWPNGVDVRVRMGLHTGEGRLGGDDYVGLDVHRAARIASAAHGGQVLVSEATAALVRASLPPGATFKDLGEHRLKDLSRPEHLFQLDISGLRTEFPPVASLDAVRVLLPEFLTEFVGRAAETGEVIEEMATARLVTLIGIGGSGKTRLAIHAGRAIAEKSRSGVVFVGLADAIDSLTIAKATADVLSLTEQAGRPIESTLVDHLKDRSDLLIFDNCEHVVTAAAELIERLLRSCPRLSVIATSREALLIDGERLVPVGSLQLPDPNRPDRALASDAVRLFVDRAQQVNPGFDPGPWIDDIDAICRRLEGIPLAIELAAARAGLLTPAEILARLEDRFGLLRSRSRSRETRHETLEAAMDWSYDLLTEESQRLLRWLSVFRGGFTLDAAQDVCYEPDADPMYVLDSLATLVERSLLLREVGLTETRFRLLETIRDYAARRLDESADRGRAESRHRAHFESFARSQTLRLSGPEQLEALDLLEMEHDNLLAVLRREADDDVDDAADLAGRLAWFWYLHAHFTEGEQWASQLLRSLPADATRSWLRLLIGAAQYDYRIGEYDRASDKLHTALGVADRLGSQRMKMWTHAYLATNEMYRVNAEEALEEAEAAIELARDEDDPIALGYATYLHVNVQTWLLLSSGRLTTERAKALTGRLAAVAQAVRSTGERNMIGHVLQSEAILLSRSGETDRATGAFDDAIAALTELGTTGCVCHCLEAIAEFTSTVGLHRQAAMLIGAADGLRESIGIRVAPVEEHFRTEAITKAAAALSPEDFDSETAAGRRLSLAEAAHLARQVLIELRQLRGTDA